VHDNNPSDFVLFDVEVPLLHEEEHLRVLQSAARTPHPWRVPRTYDPPRITFYVAGERTIRAQVHLFRHDVEALLVVARAMVCSSFALFEQAKMGLVPLPLPGLERRALRTAVRLLGRRQQQFSSSLNSDASLLNELAAVRRLDLQGAREEASALAKTGGLGGLGGGVWDTMSQRQKLHTAVSFRMQQKQILATNIDRIQQMLDAFRDGEL
jgi:hypothetical protein